MTERRTRKTGAKPGPRDEAPRGRGARAVAEMVPEIGRVAFRRFGFVQASVVSRWGEIVGPRYAEVSAPESIRFPHGKRADGVLSLVVEGAHATMMQHVAPVIVERVNRFFGYAAVVRVAIRQGKVAGGAAKRAPAISAAVPVELGDSLRAIGDPELKAVLEAMARGLSAGSAPASSVPVLGRVE